MAIYQGDKKISGNAKVSSLPLFTTQWQDHITNDASWVRSETFSWQSGAIYVSAYNHLADDLIINVETLYCWNRPDKEVYTTKENPSIGDNVYIINNGTVEFASTIDNISGDTIYPSGMQAYTRYPSGDINNQEVPVTAETETIAGTTITFYRATDGHKIVMANQESNVSAIYTATGIAWYYVLDTTNTRFKLPRSKYNFVGLRDNVGNYVAESLPNITGTLPDPFGGGSGTWTGAFARGGYNGSITTSSVDYDGYNISFDASRSSSAYQNNAPVQQRATQMYLYFYVGNTVQDQTTIDVGQITDALNGKVDLPTGGTQTSVGLLVESYSSGTSWYRVYSDGWCEQGGLFSGSTNVPANGDYTYLVNLLKSYKDTTYNVTIGGVQSASRYVVYGLAAGYESSSYTRTTSSFNVMAHNYYGGALPAQFFWVAYGYIS